jgi:hypothetical protein
MSTRPAEQHHEERGVGDALRLARKVRADLDRIEKHHTERLVAAEALAKQAGALARGNFARVADVEAAFALVVGLAAMRLSPDARESLAKDLDCYAASLKKERASLAATLALAASQVREAGDLEAQLARAKQSLAKLVTEEIAP